LIIVGAGALLGLLSPLGFVPTAVGPFLVAFGAIIAAPESSLPGRWLGPWWRLAALSAFVCLVGLGVWFLSERAGTAIVMLGSLPAAFAVAFGYRPRD
jgi:hypothetical protein